jgi:hypothetical protein
VKNVVNKKPRKNSPESFRFEPVWKGKKPNRTEPKLIGLNRFSVRFGSKTKKKTNSVWLFILVQNRTEPKMFSPMHTSSLKRATSSMVEHIHLLPFHERNKLNDDIHDKAITIARSDIPG